MATSSWRVHTAILVSFLVALTLGIFPLYDVLQWWRPEFVLLVAIYWLYNAPDHLSLVLLCAVGLFQDVLEGAPFGQHGLSMALVAYVCLLSQSRIRKLSLAKQMLLVFILVAGAQVADNWVQSMAGLPLAGTKLFFPAVASALAWPIVRWWLQRSGAHQPSMHD